MSETQFTFSNLVIKIIAEEARQKDASGEIEETAFCVGRRRVKGEFEEETSSQCKRDVKVQCYKCGSRGYFARDCWKTKSKDKEEDAKF